MSIEFKDGRYFSQLWFVGNGSMDWMAALWKEEDTPEKRWHLQYRFRYYNVPEAFDNDKDTKNWYHFTIDGDSSEEKAIASLDMIAELTKARFGCDDISRVVIRSNEARKAMEALEAQPWAHCGFEDKLGKIVPLGDGTGVQQ